MSRDKKIVLSIAGSDPSGGAGIQADLKVACLLEVYACSVITSVTAQNSMKISGVWPLEADMVRKQLDAVLSDFHPDAVKIGLLGCEDTIGVVADFIRRHDLQNVVVDPVLSLTLENNPAGHDYIRKMIEEMLPLATLITPNLPEKESLEKEAGMPLEDIANAVLVKGGHNDGDFSEDVLLMQAIEPDSAIAPSSAFPTINFNHSSLFDHSDRVPKNFEERHIYRHAFRNRRLKTANTHGSGCVLSSAIACYLAKGYHLEKAVDLAVKFTHESLRQSAGAKLTTGSYGPSLI